VGLAASSKYNGVLSAVPVVAAHFCRRGWGGLRDPRLLLSGAAAAGAFVLTTPYALLDTDAFLDGVEAERRHYSTGHAGHEAGAALDYLGAAWRSLGPALVLAAVGAAAWWRRRWREVAVLLAAVVPAFVFISLFEVSFDRNVVPLLPPLTVLAAGGTAVVVDAGVRRWPGRAWWPAVAAVLLVPLVLVSGRDARAANEDERAGARSWIEANVAPGSRLVVEAYGPWIDPERFWVKGFKEVARRPEGFFERRQIDYIVAAEERYGRYLDDPGRYPREAAAYRRLFERYPTAARFGDDGSRIVILQVAPPPG
jgi:predicted kinase